MTSPLPNAADRSWMSGAEVASALGFAPATVRARSADLGGYRLGKCWRYPRERVLALRGQTHTLRKPSATLQMLVAEMRRLSNSARDRDNRVTAEIATLKAQLAALKAK